MERLDELYASHKGKVSDKWEAYLAEYDRVFSPMRANPVTLLEIGVQNGGSLEIWARYFASARKVVGCDLDPACGQLAFDDERIAVAVGDATTADGEAAVARHARSFDIVIDDGSHRSGDVVMAFSRFFPRVGDGGVYVVEDLHTSYWADFDGGFAFPLSAVAFFKRLADVVNYHHWGLPSERHDALLHFGAAYGIDVAAIALDRVHAVEFTNSLCVVRKDRQKNNRLGRRIIAGTVASVVPSTLLWKDRPPPLSDQSNSKWSFTAPAEAELDTLRSAAHDLENGLARQARLLHRRETTIHRLGAVVEQRDDAIRTLASSNHALSAAINELFSRVAESERQLRADQAEAAHGLAQAHAELAARTGEVGTLQRRLLEIEQRLHTESGRANREIRLLRQHLDVLYDSRSWRVTSPLRALAQAGRAILRSATGTRRRASAHATPGAARAAGVLGRTYQWVMPSVLKEKVPARLRSRLRRVFHESGIPVSDFGDRSLGQLIAEAEGALRGRQHQRALQLWLTVLAKHGDNQAVAGRARLNASVARRLLSIHEYEQAIARYSAAREDRRRSGVRPRIAIYTAIAGEYDSVKLPEEIDSTLDYVLFTDRPVAATEVWQVRPLTYFDIDPTRAARYAKTHPHTLLSDYDVVVWVDANVMILGDITPMIARLLESGRPVGAVPHPLRSSAYDEADACIKLQKDDAGVIRDQVSTYADAGFEHDDLIESNFIMFDLRHKSVARFLTTWWRHIVQYSRRDQLSLNYALRQAGVAWYPLMSRPDNVRNCAQLGYLPHDQDTGGPAMLIEALRSPLSDPFVGPAFAQFRDDRVAARSEIDIDVVVCVRDAPSEVTACLDAIDRCRASERQRLVIVDDGSLDTTATLVREFAASRDWVSLHRHDVALGYTRAANQGMRLSTAGFVILLNSDTVVTQSWAEKLADVAYGLPGVGIVGPLSNAASHQSIPEHRSSATQTAVNVLPQGWSPEDVNRLCERWTIVDVLPLVPLIHGFCFGVRRDVIEAIGLFDEERFPRGYGEENDYCFRAADSGFGLAVASHTYVFHAKSRSYDARDRVALMRAGSASLKQMYGNRRVDSAVRSMQEHPLLRRVRALARQDLVEERNDG